MSEKPLDNNYYWNPFSLKRFMNAGCLLQCPGFWLVKVILSKNKSVLSIFLMSVSPPFQTTIFAQSSFQI